MEIDGTEKSNANFSGTKEDNVVPRSGPNLESNYLRGKSTR